MAVKPFSSAYRAASKTNRYLFFSSPEKKIRLNSMAVRPP